MNPEQIAAGLTEAQRIWKRACEGREGYCSPDLQEAAVWAIGEAFRIAEEAARSATLPPDYQWSNSNRQKFELGRDAAADAVRALLESRDRPQPNRESRDAE